MPSVDERPARSTVKLDAVCAAAVDIARDAALAAARESLHDAVLTEVAEVADRVSSVEETAADQAPADQAPADQAPADQAPADQAPADQAPADEIAADLESDALAQGDGVGAYLGVEAEAERVVTHRFEASVPGYTGWLWSVTIARASRAKTVTVDEVLLLPGSDSLLAPAWVPWSERVRPGDLHPGDLVPAIADDPRLVPAYILSDDPVVEQVCAELGVGREHVMSRDGLVWTAERWVEGETGPHTAMARHAPANCGTCGFFLPLAGSMSVAFGACANEISNVDGRVVSVDHGCGAHSEVVIEAALLAGPVGEVYEDDFV